MPPAEIVEKIKSCGPQWAEVVAAKATKTGFQITTTSKTARERLEKEKPSMAFTSAKPLIKGYAIQVHMVNKSEKVFSREILNQWEKENQRMHLGLKILRARWKKWETQQQKKKGTAIIEVNTPEIAKKLVQEGFIANAEILPTEA
jgi:hypothetical protein